MSLLRVALRLIVGVNICVHHASPAGSRPIRKLVTSIIRSAAGDDFSAGQLGRDARFGYAL
jgi:hypothetical protein